MNREDLLNKVVGSSLGRKRTINHPIELRITKNKSPEKVSQLRLYVRNDVYHFSEQERWSVSYDNESRKMYFFYGVFGIPSFKVQHTKSNFNYIQFTNKDILEIVENNNNTICTTWAFDEECKAYFIQL